MISGWELWLLLVGLAVGAAVVFVALVRLPRAEDDVSEAERQSEAGWIAEAIERGGGVAPVSFVAEVLELHQAYLRAPRVSLPGGAAVPPLPPPPAPDLQPGPYPQPVPYSQPASHPQPVRSPQPVPHPQPAGQQQRPVPPPTPRGPLPPPGTGQTG